MDLPAPQTDAFTAAQLRFATAAWPMRAAEELRSALIFRALARAARDGGVPEPWPSHFRAAMRDEVRHARLCAFVGSRLGAEQPAYDPGRVHVRLSRLADPLHRVLSLLLVEVAMGETISMLLFRAGRRAATEPLTRAALMSILADEVRHQRLGWSALTALWPTLSPALRDEAQREASSGLASCEEGVAVPAMRWLQAGHTFDPALARLGVLHPESRVETFYFAVERLVLPRLVRLGLDGERAWKERYRERGGAR
jgi:hypothetical protein